MPRHKNDPEITKAISTYLREQRKLLGITQEEMATRVGTHRMAIQSWELGLCCPSFVTMVKLAPVLGMTTAKLFTQFGSVIQKHLQEKGV